ncbi:MAG: CopG family transcriptional regulator, partial [Acidimicrobiia bacterium]|nr:CopG family transcriptional regulator [Acidimicrobiia bacterium]
MLCIMRTTISLDDQLAKQVRRAAEASGVSVSAFIAQILNDAIKHRNPPETPPFQLVT